MKRTVSIKEYDKLHIRQKRDLSKNIISETDAAYLQSVVIDNAPVFSFGNRCLVAQQWVGVIQLPEFSIEILPKIYGELSYDMLRDILVRMLLVSHQTDSIRRFKASLSTKKNSLFEMLIETYLKELQLYAESGLQREYRKLSLNIQKVKGRIVFNQQLKRNVLAPTRFFCRYSSYEADTELNRFFKTCLMQMAFVTRDQQNKQMIDDLGTFFSSIQDVSVEQALSYEIHFNSINERARQAYQYGRLFLENVYSTLNAGNTEIFSMLFNMEHLYELFVYRVASLVFGNRVTYQKRGAYLVSRDSDQKKFVNLRPDMTFKVNDSECWIIDTKWKIINKTIKESDAYQMNAYSTGINNVSKVILLYPRVSHNDNLVGYYSFLSGANISPRRLEVKTIDLAGCLAWNRFLKDFRTMFD